MKTNNNNNCLTIFLEGRIDTNNAPQVEKELLAAAEGKTDVVLDAEKLVYISSAGLRVLMKLRKSLAKLPMINVSRDVYDILETTGFTELLDVKKALRQVSVDGCEVIGAGGYGTVYRIDEETVLKVYNTSSQELVESERLMSQRAFVNGIPTAIPYDTVKVGEKFGVVYELINAGTVAQFITAEPDKLEKYVRLFARELKKFHTIEIDDALCADKKQYFYDITKTLGKYMTAEETAEITNYIDSIPDCKTFLHGDYNFRNVLLNDGEVILIDIGDAGTGHPALDVAGVSIVCNYLKYTQLPPEEIRRLLGFDPELTDKIWYFFCSEYFGISTPEQVKQYTEMLTPIMMLDIVCHSLRRYAELTEEDYLVRVNGLVRGRLLPAIRKNIPLDF